MSCKTSYALIVRKCFQAMDVLESTKYVLLKYFDTIRAHNVMKHIHNMYKCNMYVT